MEQRSAFMIFLVNNATDRIIYRRPWYGFALVTMLQKVDCELNVVFSH